MWVKLKRDLFIGGNLYKAVDTGTEISDEFRDQLPKDAEVMSDRPTPVPASTDHTRMTAKALEELNVEERAPPLSPLKPTPKALSELKEEDHPLPPPSAIIGKVHPQPFKPSDVPHKDTPKKFDDK